MRDVGGSGAFLNLRVNRQARVGTDSPHPQPVTSFQLVSSCAARPLSQHGFYLVPHVFDIVAIVLAVSVALDAPRRLLLVPMESWAASSTQRDRLIDKLVSSPGSPGSC
jgi:hypothetical protein